MGGIFEDIRSTGLGKVAKRATKMRKRTTKSVKEKYKSHVKEVDRLRTFDKLSPKGKAAMIASELKKQKKANKKKYGYEYAKPFKLDKLSSKATKQRNKLAGAKPKAKYNKWGDRVS